MDCFATWNRVLWLSSNHRQQQTARWQHAEAIAYPAFDFFFKAETATSRPFHTYKDQNFIRCLQVYFKLSNSFAGHWSMCMRMGLHHELWWKTRCFSFCTQGSLYDTNPKQFTIITEILPIYHTCALFDFPQVIEWPLVYTGNNIKMSQTWLHQTQSIIRFQQLLRREFS